MTKIGQNRTSRTPRQRGSPPAQRRPTPCTTSPYTAADGNRRPLPHLLSGDIARKPVPCRTPQDSGPAKPIARRVAAGSGAVAYSAGVASQTFTVLSLLADARWRPSGLNAKLVTASAWPRRVKTSWRSAVSQSFTVASSLAEARRRPSGLKATAVTPRLCPLRVNHSRPSADPQSFTVLSEPAEARHRPSGLKATARTGAVCPLRVHNSRPSAASQTFTALSALAEASSRPSGL